MKFAQSTTGAVVLLSTLAQAVPCVKPKFEDKQAKSFCCNIEKPANDSNIVTDLPGMVGTPCALYKISVQEICPQGSTDKKKCKVRVQSAETVPPTNWTSVTQFPDIVDTPGGVKNLETHVKGKIYKPKQTPGQTTNDFIQQYKPSQEPKNEEDEDACVQELSATSGQPDQPGHDEFVAGGTANEALHVFVLLL
ncbi:hypothetical protein ED733_007884 [Metarhizium rileyi]|uniref:Uncharacterized protein n=1 Tax=Metarhizium rileyi (strain RCEF 4871) TaxID=1649241 RepID=A0A5C6GGK0_METRR|nr:hypothetical protein ED733_007884 [Metarhizium rileyi]